jgi:hypothetical protein
MGKPGKDEKELMEKHIEQEISELQNSIVLYSTELENVEQRILNLLHHVAGVQHAVAAHLKAKGASP